MKSLLCAIFATLFAAVIGIGSVYAYASLPIQVQVPVANVSLSIWGAAVAVLVTIGVVDLWKGNVVL